MSLRQHRIAYRCSTTASAGTTLTRSTALTCIASYIPDNLNNNTVPKGTRENRSYIWLPGKGGKRNRWGRSDAPLAARRPLLRVGGWENKIVCGSGGEYRHYGGYS
jgi:hypothetical protein